MTKTQLIKKLQKIHDLITEIVCDDIDELIESNEERMENIQSRAYDRISGELTSNEEDKICELEEENENLENLKVEMDFDVETLIDTYLR